MATNTAYRDWADESDEILATVVDQLKRNAEEVKKNGSRRRR